MLSKRADTKEKLISLIKTLWRNSEGPFENTFRLISYAGVVLPGGFILIALDKIASMFGMGLEDLGKYLDKKLNLGPNATINESHIDEAANVIEELTRKEASKNNSLVKNAGIVSFITKGGIKTTFKGLWMLIKWLLTALALTNLGDLYKLNTQEVQKDNTSNNLNNLNQPKEKDEEAGSLIDELNKKYK